MERPKEATFNQIADWYLNLTPSYITIHSFQTGLHIEEPSFVAMQVKDKSTYTGIDPRTGEAYTQILFEPKKFLSVGKAALEYKNTQDAIVFSPFRHGQIAQYAAAEYFIKTLLKQVVPKFAILKPVLLVHVQRQTTEVEERAIIDIGIQAGARKVFLYQEPLSEMLRQPPAYKPLKKAVLIHIDPQD